MVAVKASFYVISDELTDICEAVSVPDYLRRVRLEFNLKSAEDLATLDPEENLPGGPVYYSDAPRICIESPTGKIYKMDEIISDCIRAAEKRDAAEKRRDKSPSWLGAEKNDLAGIIARRAARNKTFRKELLSFSMIPQSWGDLVLPSDTDEALDVATFKQKLIDMDDRDYSHPTNAKGPLHPLARIFSSKIFSDKKKLGFIADYVIGRRKNIVSHAVRIGTASHYREFNRVAWLEQNGAYVLEKVKDLTELKSHFTAQNKIRQGAVPDLHQLEQGALKIGAAP